MDTSAGSNSTPTNIDGNASTATALQTPRNIQGVKFDGTEDIKLDIKAEELSGTTLSSNITKSNLTSVGVLTDLTVINPIKGTIIGSDVSIIGNAGSATKLENARNINGVPFDGTQDIVVVADANTLTGDTIPTNIKYSSLTSVGVLDYLTVRTPIVGDLTGNADTANLATNVLTNANLSGDVSSVGNVTTINSHKVINSMLQTVATSTFKGRITSGTGDVEDLTSTQATSILNTMVGDSGSGGTKGLVPAPITGDSTKFLRGDGTWAPASYSSGVMWDYKANTVATSGSPSSGHLLWNNATQISATELHVHKLADDGIDLSIFLSLLDTAYLLYIQDVNNAANYQTWQISGTTTDVGSVYWVVPVTLVNSGGTGTTGFSNNAQILVINKTSASSFVSSVSVVAANGFDGTVANAYTNPAITLKTTITGIIKGNGTSISAAISGTDYQPALGFTPEDVANKQTDLTASATKYPTVNAVNTGLSNTLSAAETYSANPANITQDSTHRFSSDSEKSTWNGKQDALGFTPEDVANKQTNLTASATKYPTVNAVNTGLGLKVDQTTTVNGHALTSNISLSYSDVGADASGAAASALSSAQSYADGKVQNSLVASTTIAPSASAVNTGLSGTLTTAEGYTDTQIGIEASSRSTADTRLLSPNSGVLTGLAVTINVDPTKFDIAAGTGIVVDWTTPATPTITYVSYAGSTGNTIPSMAAGYTRIYIDKTGTLIKSSGGLDTASFRRNYIVLPILYHPDHATITNVSTDRKPAYEEVEALNDYVKALGPINTGNGITANGANLNINKAAGVFTVLWANQSTDGQDPCNVTMSSATSPSFATVYRNGSGGNTETVPASTVDVTHYDDGSGTLATLTASYWVNNRFYVFPNNQIVMAYGQSQYKTSADAVAAIYTETFVAPVGYTQGKAVTVVSVQKSSTNLSTQAIFTNLNTLTAGGLNVTIPSLQAAFNASPVSPTPDIITNSVNKTFSIQGGSGSDTDSNFSSYDNAGSLTASITAAGVITGSSITDTTVGSSISGATAKTTPVSADSVGVSDSADSNKLKKTTFANIASWISANVNALTSTTLQTARNIDGQSFDGSTSITVIAPGTHAATSKTTPVDADELPIVDSAASNILKKLTFANLKAWIKTYTDTLYLSITQPTTTLSSSSGVVTIDLSLNYRRYELTLTENVTSWVFTNVPASGYFREIIVVVIQHASAAKTVITPATSRRTAGGIAWVASTTLSSREALVLHILSDSTVTLYPTGVQV